MINVKKDGKYHNVKNVKNVKKIIIMQKITT